jgi:hypothetical protein
MVAPPDLPGKKALIQSSAHVWKASAMSLDLALGCCRSAPLLPLHVHRAERRLADMFNGPRLARSRAIALPGQRGAGLDDVV